jgi:hypothetical protein
VNALVRTTAGVFAVDVDGEELLGLEPAASLCARSVEVGLPRVLVADAAGSTVVAVVDRRPPLMISHDAGRTWREAGGGLPQGRAVAIAPDDPDLVLYAARNRLYLSEDGGRFWRVLGFELPEIEAIAWDATTGRCR